MITGSNVQSVEPSLYCWLQSSWPIRIFSDTPSDAIFLSGRGVIRGVTGLSDIDDIDRSGAGGGGGGVGET